MVVFKASLSYRFVGDMGDHFWSGYLLAYLPGGSKIFIEPAAGLGIHIALKEIAKWFDESTKHDQRKILQPFIVEKMAAELYQSTEKIIEVINVWLDPVENSPRNRKDKPEKNGNEAEPRTSTCSIIG